MNYGSGDADGRVPVIGYRYWVGALGVTLNTPWRNWHLNKHVRTKNQFRSTHENFNGQYFYLSRCKRHIYSWLNTNIRIFLLV